MTNFGAISESSKIKNKFRNNISKGNLVKILKMVQLNNTMAVVFKLLLYTAHRRL